MARSALDYLDRFPLDRVREIHLGGHDADADDAGEPLLIDSHRVAVADEVWALYGEVIARTGALPTLIEWDNDVPDWPTLRAEAVAARRYPVRRGARVGGMRDAMPATFETSFAEALLGAEHGRSGRHCGT